MNLRRNLAGIALVTVLLVVTAVRTPWRWTRRLITRRPAGGICYVTPVTSGHITGLVSYLYHNTGQPGEPDTGWYWGQLYADGQVDSWDGSCYLTESSARRAASEYDPSVLVGGGL